jgi:hypothetical protein
MINLQSNSGSIDVFLVSDHNQDQLQHTSGELGHTDKESDAAAPIGPSFESNSMGNFHSPSLVPRQSSATFSPLPRAPSHL